MENKSDEKILNALQSLGADTTKISKSARLRALLPGIEQARAQGVKHQDIVLALNREGFEISYHVYRNMLTRLRKQAKKRNDSFEIDLPRPPTMVGKRQAANATGESLVGWDPFKPVKY